MIQGVRKLDALRVPRPPSRTGRLTRTETRLRVESLDSRRLLSASIAAAPSFVPNETVDQPVGLVDFTSGMPFTESGTLGQGPAGAADVEWYQFTIANAATLTASLARQTGDTTFQGVLSLFNSDPYDFGDPYNSDGYRLVDQIDQTSPNTPASLDEVLSPGTYNIAISGHGNLDFHPLIASSGLPGATGSYQLTLDLTDLGPAAPNGPVVLASDPAPNSILDASPFAIRLDLNDALDPSTITPGQTVSLSYLPIGDSNPQDAVPVSLSSTNFSNAIDELQLFPSAPLAPGTYTVTLAGDNSSGQPVLATFDGRNLGLDGTHQSGADYSYSFTVDGIKGYVGAAASADDTPAKSHNLGDIAGSGVLRVQGAIGDDPFYNPASSADPTNPDPIYNPGNVVDLYHFQITGDGRYAVVAEIFAGRIGSPLDAGLSLYRLNVATQSLEFVDGNNNSYNPTPTTDQSATPLFLDPVLFDSLQAGDYYLAVSSGTNTPTPREGTPLDTPGLFNPLESHSGSIGSSTGAYVLNLVVQQSPNPPHVVSTSPAGGATLNQAPSQIVVKFDAPVNIASAAFQSFQQSSQSTIASIYIQADDGTKYLPRFVSYDSATNTATLILLNRLPNGHYALHLSGPNGLTDIAGNPLAANDPSGDYVSQFTVNGPEVGIGGDPLRRYDQEPNNDDASAEDLGMLFPEELHSGVIITRDFRSLPTFAPSDTADDYKFQVLQTKSYGIALTNLGSFAGVSLDLTYADGTPAPVSSFNKGQALFGTLTPGTYLLRVSGWAETDAVNVAYRIRMTMVGSEDNAPPLFASPAPAVSLRLDSLAPPTPTPTPDPVSPPSPVSTPSPPSGSGGGAGGPNEGTFPQPLNGEGTQQSEGSGGSSGAGLGGLAAGLIGGEGGIGGAHASPALSAQLAVLTPFGVPGMNGGKASTTSSASGATAFAGASSDLDHGIGDNGTPWSIRSEASIGMLLTTILPLTFAEAEDPSSDVPVAQNPQVASAEFSAGSTEQENVAAASETEVIVSQPDAAAPNPRATPDASRAATLTATSNQVVEVSIAGGSSGPEPEKRESDTVHWLPLGLSLVGISTLAYANWLRPHRRATADGSNGQRSATGPALLGDGKRQWSFGSSVSIFAKSFWKIRRSEIEKRSVQIVRNAGTDASEPELVETTAAATVQLAGPSSNRTRRPIR
jgi:methionine-rich copper-binding protein CopC